MESCIISYKFSTFPFFQEASVFTDNFAWLLVGHPKSKAMLDSPLPPPLPRLKKTWVEVMSVLRFNENARVFSFLCHLNGLTFQAGQESRGVGRILQTVTLKWADTNCKVEASGTSRLEILQSQSNSGAPPRWNMLQGLFNVSPGLWTPTATCFGSPRGTRGCEKGRWTSGCLTRCGCWTTGTKDKWTDGRIQLRYEIKDKICRADGFYSDY